MIKALLKKVLPNALIEERSIRRWYEVKQTDIPTLDTAIAQIESRWNFRPPNIPDSPVFIFSTEWRSGSTLLQRLVNSDTRILVWGEPYNQGNFIQCLSDSLRSFTLDNPPDSYFINSSNFKNSEGVLARRWTANLYPDLPSLVNAHQNFYKTLYEKPALERGFERWGIKEVRLTIEHAYYLKWLFPNAKFLFLYRNPYDAYQSCHNWRGLYMRWPDSPVLNPEIFGTYWKQMLEGFQEGVDRVNGFLIKYEDFLMGEPSIDKLSSYLDLDLNAAVMDIKIGSQSKKVPLTTKQLRRLKKVVDPLATQLGYVGLNSQRSR
ncbi:sulfotransferase [Oscillatoria sp. CS-180]|uniref:sulfotransferase n=1 Tax=Oscillatoria sp. CS-180 TaxID=3021720 RepID=UPI00233054AB|nr:sulfotransferase [Oscillatoria sp. CS-180]MDB9527246.1 sulfotransferase [Oscillatoria sp. CS-180]